eukprot:TRINITY_DN5188_c0_g1_i1.p1 TRINITY_DN5188_c0_g1~~TRINITY_DN5188_c0_g1_i1.p1  ORF type:complete len:239 (-),score=50.06 TRINITY_DN5188_c0_g1_i1:62-778(-)
MPRSAKKVTPVDADNGLAEIDAIANGNKFPMLNLDQDTVQEVQMSWAMFIDHKGGLEEAEDAILRKLKKAEPNFAVCIYGDTARPHTEGIEEDGGLRARKKVEATVSYDSPEGRRRMAAIMKAGQDTRGFAGAHAAAEEVVQATTAVQPKAKGMGKGQQRRASESGSQLSRRSSGESELGLTEPSVTATEDSCSNRPSTPGSIPIIMVTPASPFQRPTLWRSPSSLSSESARSRKVSL